MNKGNCISVSTSLLLLCLLLGSIVLGTYELSLNLHYREKQQVHSSVSILCWITEIGGLYGGWQGREAKMGGGRKEEKTARGSPAFEYRQCVRAVNK